MGNWPTTVTVTLTPFGQEKTDVLVSLTVRYLLDVPSVNPVSHEFWIRELDRMEAYARGAILPSEDSYHALTRAWRNREFLGFVAILAVFCIGAAVISVTAVLFGLVALPLIQFALVSFVAMIVIMLVVIIYNLREVNVH